MKLGSSEVLRLETVETPSVRSEMAEILRGLGLSLPWALGLRWKAPSLSCVAAAVTIVCELSFDMWYSEIVD